MDRRPRSVRFVDCLGTEVDLSSSLLSSLASLYVALGDELCFYAVDRFADREGTDVSVQEEGEADDVREEVDLVDGTELHGMDVQLDDRGQLEGVREEFLAFLEPEGAQGYPAAGTSSRIALRVAALLARDATA
ncbi:hypothetical protein [Streptomyces sp. NPDC047525]|uniref:hypothetical protein n=1 Tax=Streptomyces sp. NPDC047525 TaxID=3155264 RepID=UPI0033C7C59C